MHYGFGYGVRTVYLPVSDLVALAIELRDDPSAAALDRKHIVARAVRDEDGRFVPAQYKRGYREGGELGTLEGGSQDEGHIRQYRALSLRSATASDCIDRVERSSTGASHILV